MHTELLNLRSLATPNHPFGASVAGEDDCIYLKVYSPSTPPRISIHGLGRGRIAPTSSKLPPHKACCEVFAGAAWVFFRKEPSKYEVINDLDGDLVCFYRVLQNHLEEFLKQFKWLLASMEWIKKPIKRH